MTDTVVKNNYLKLIIYWLYLSGLDKLEGVGLQFLLHKSSCGELTDATVHTPEVIVNTQSLINSNALQLDGCHGAVKTGKISLRPFLPLA